MDNAAQIENPIRKEFEQFQQLFRKSIIATENPLLQMVWDYVAAKQGKQLRPQLTLLSAQLCKGITDKTLDSAIALELVHTASLIHDDVVDCSPMRRGRESVHTRWDNKVAVLVGDYILAKVIDIIAKIRNQRILGVVSQLSAQLSSGEILQLHANNSMWISEEQYNLVIKKKTAYLFAACAEVGAISAGASEKQTTALRNFGEHLGMCFQIQDDILDYSDSDMLGKPTMSDIRDGKATLPLLKALERAPQEEAEEIRLLCEQLNNGVAPSNNDPNDVDQRIKNFVLRYDGIGYARSVMEQHKKKAVEALKAFHDSRSKESLLLMLEHAMQRLY